VTTGKKNYNSQIYNQKYILIQEYYTYTYSTIYVMAETMNIQVLISTQQLKVTFIAQCTSH